jgi:hypothetical protein
VANLSLRTAASFNRQVSGVSGVTGSLIRLCRLLDDFVWTAILQDFF